MNQPLRIAFRDFPGRFNPDRIAALLSRRFAITEVDHSPDYVIHSVFGYSFLRDVDAVRIAFIGENVRPDFNLSDYAFAYDWMSFGDRYHRAPNYVLYEAFHDLVAGRQPVTPPAFSERRFCNFLYSNSDGHPLREEIFDRLSAIGPVDSAGKHRRNVEPISVAAYKGNWDRAAVAWQSGYKFSISVENSSTPGYSTEKIVHAFAAGTIPVYFGDPLIGRVFNAERFIDVGTLGLDAAIDRVRHLASDESAYAEVVSRPVFRDGRVPEELTEAGLLDAFEAIFRQPKHQARRRSPHFWGRKYEDRCRRAFLRPRLFFLNGWR